MWPPDPDTDANSTSQISQLSSTPLAPPTSAPTPDSQPSIPPGIEEHFPQNLICIQQAFLDTAYLGIEDAHTFVFPLFPKVWSGTTRKQGGRPLQQDDFLILVVFNPDPRQNPLVVSPTTEWHRTPRDVQSRTFYHHLRNSPELTYPATFHSSQPTRWTVFGRAYPYHRDFKFKNWQEHE